MRNRRLLTSALITAFLLFPGKSALAQNSVGGQDPFAIIHARLVSVADASLAKMREPRPIETTEPPLASYSRDGRPSAVLSNVSLSRVRMAQSRLQELNVDAARIFVEEGVPLELLVVAGVESSFNPLALSPKGARGTWQLMPATAERFGLRVNGELDERTHPQRSTRAAARYLRTLYEQFGDWLLVLAAYNAGEQRVAKAIEHGGTRDFWQLSQQRLLPTETRRYVPRVLHSEDLR